MSIPPSRLEAAGKELCMKKYILATRCVDQVGPKGVDDLRDLYANDREVTYATFAKHCDSEAFARDLGYALGPKTGLHLKHDRCVRFYKSKWKGKPCFYVDQSRVDFIFLPREEVAQAMKASWS
jgi:hypothetical protein